MTSENQFATFMFIMILCWMGKLNDPFETCNRYTSFGYGYRDFFEFREGNFSPNQVFYLEFYVKTGSNAHILLKPDINVEKGYEIVIGGGSNTFSQIRLLEPDSKKTIITQKTEDFLSGEEYRLFWISIDKLGIISVGKKENDEVFINWRFDEPFLIKFFSFGSWTNMKADWRFGCKDQKDIIQEEKSLSPVVKLKRDLFTLYDPNVLPVGKRATLEVKVNFQINNVKLDEKKGQLLMWGTADLKWTDGKVKWKPENYNGIETIYIPPFQIWTPSIRVLNALNFDKAPLFDLTAAGVVAKYDGSIFWRPPFNSLSHCAVDLKFWPFDVHNCSVLFGFWMEPSNLVLTVMDEYDTLTGEKADSIWEIMEVIPFNTNHPDEDENYGILYVELKRASGPLTLIVTIPYFGTEISSLAAVFMTLASFLLPLQSSLKLSLVCGSLVILLLNLFLLGLIIPAMTASVPKAINLYSWSFVITSVPILLFVILNNVEFTMEIPEMLSKVLNNQIFGMIFCLPNLNVSSMEYSFLNDEVNKLNKNRLTSIRLVTFIERLFFIGYAITMGLLPFII